MKIPYIKLSLATVLLLAVYSCKKGEASVSGYEISENADSAAVSEDISSAATMKVKDKQFIRTAEVNMEVKNVYDATISIEKSAQELGGFVIHSDLQSRVISEDTYNTSNEESILIKKYQAENSLQVRVPTSKLGEFLTFINDKKLFLNSRVINAEDVTSSIQYAEMEGERIKKNSEDISALKTTKDKVKMNNENRSENNQQQLANLEVNDKLKYSTVDIYLKEPKLRIAEIAVTNIQNIDSKYKFNFMYDVKNAFVEGFYLIQRILVGLVTIWPIVLIIIITFYFYRKHQSKKKIKQQSV